MRRKHRTKRVKHRRTHAAAPHRRRRRASGLGEFNFRRRFRRGSRKIALSAQGIKRAIDFKTVGMAIAGGLAARAAYGLVTQEAPEQSNAVRAAIGAAIPIAAAILISGSARTVVPVATGALSAVGIDMLGGSVADAVPDKYPLVKAVLSGGMTVVTQQAALPPATEAPASALPSGVSGYENIPDRIGGLSGIIDLPDRQGIGDVDFIY
jgi:hypothetical protein